LIDPPTYILLTSSKLERNARRLTKEEKDRHRGDKRSARREREKTAHTRGAQNDRGKATRNYLQLVSCWVVLLPTILLLLKELDRLLLL